MPSPFGIADHSKFSGFGGELVFGRRSDGSHVHISEVPRGLACGCACPACDGELIAAKGPKTAHHFKHRQGLTVCSFGAETNAHVWAKRVLERLKRIYLPPVFASAGNRKHLLHPGRWFSFDAVRLEKRMGEIIPDVIVTAKGRELIVEVYVTHKCDGAKIAKIKAGGVSAIEVDLSAFRVSDDERAVAKAFLKSAKREWLFNVISTKGESRLCQEIQEERRKTEEAADREARTLISEALHADPMPSEQIRAERDLVAQLGCSALIGIDHGSDDGFIVPPSMWQAAILKAATRRREEGRRRVQDIIAKLVPTSDKFDLRAWFEAVPGLDRSFDDIATEDEADWDRLCRAFGAIERMLSGGKPADDLLGLPLEAEVSRAEEQQARIREEEDRRAAEKARAEGEARVVALTSRARDLVGLRAEEWLSRRRDKDGATPVDVARASDEGLSLTLGALHRFSDKLEEKAARDREIEGYREELRKKAKAAYATEELAELFLKTSMSAMNPKTPLEYCVDARTFAECVARLRNVRHGR